MRANFWTLVAVCMLLVSSTAQAQMAPGPGGNWLHSTGYTEAYPEMGGYETGAYEDAYAGSYADSYDCTQYFNGRRAPHILGGALFVEGEGLLLERTGGSTQTLAFINGQPLDGRELEFYPEVCPRLSVTMLTNGVWDIEGVYIGVFDNRSTVNIGTPFTYKVAQGSYLAANTGVIDYRTELHNVELNFRKMLFRKPWLQLIVGGRWGQISENYRVMGQDGGAGAFLYDVDVNNHFYGTQAGIIYTYERGPFRMDLSTKLGGGANRGDRDVILSSAQLAGVDSVEEWESLFFGEFRAAGAWQISAHFAIRGGFHVMWFDGIALAPDQIPHVSLGGNGSYDPSQATYFGGFFGLEGAF